MMTSPTIYDHLLAAVLGLILPVAGAMQRRQALRDADESAPPFLDPGQKIALYWVNSAVLAFLGAGGLLAWRSAGRTWQDLGLTLPPERFGWGLLLALLFLLLFAFDTCRQLAPERLPATRTRWRRDTPFMPETTREFRHSLILVTSASLFEEILYRGFLIAYVGRFTGPSLPGLVVAVTLPAAVFGASHAYQGVRAVIKIFFLAALFGTIFVITRSLWIPVALHLAVDLVGMLLAPKVLSPGPPESEEEKA